MGNIATNGKTCNKNILMGFDSGGEEFGRLKLFLILKTNQNQYQL